MNLSTVTKRGAIAVAGFLLLGAGCFTSEEATTLDLSGKNLDKVPGYVLELTKLESLNLSNNNLIDALPGEIGRLRELRTLDASKNGMTGIPSEIGKLVNLEVLNLSENKLTGLPLELGELKKLRTLDLRGNDISTLDLDAIRSRLTTTEILL